MTAKDYLLRYRYIGAGIDIKREQQRYFRELATKITAGSESLPRSSEISDKVGRNAARIADIEIEIQNDIARSLELYREIIHKVSEVPNIVERQVLENIYINGCSLAATAETIGYSIAQTERFHLAALETFQKLIANDKP